MEIPIQLNRVLFPIGLLLILSGIVHLAIWQWSGTPWAGQVSWRKPALFGISGGLMLLSFAWLAPRLPPRRRDRLMISLLGFSMLIEVALITLQQWRGVPSHFNTSTFLDTLVDSGMTIAIGLVTLCLFDLGLRVFIRWEQPLDVRLAWRSGIAFLFVSCLIGVFILVYGAYRASLGLDPTRFGASGVVKFPHGMTIHAVQFLPLLVWFLTRTGFPVRLRVSALKAASCFLALLLMVSVHQTIEGRSRMDLTMISIALLGLAVVCWLPVGRKIFRWLRLGTKEG